MLALAIVLGFAATCLGAFVPMHEQADHFSFSMSKDGVSSSSHTTKYSLYTREPQVGMTLIAAGLIAAAIAGLLLFGNGNNGSVSFGSKLAIVFMAGIILVLHLVAALAPGMLMNPLSCMSRSYMPNFMDLQQRGPPLFANVPGPMYLWLFVGLVVCVGISYIALKSIE